jgi:pectinesterase
MNRYNFGYIVLLVFLSIFSLRSFALALAHSGPTSGLTAPGGPTGEQRVQYDFTVDATGNGDFKTVQQAINAVPDFRKNETVIFIRNGTYKEKLILPASKTMVTFIGEDKEKTILTNDDYASKKNRFGEEMGTTGSTSFYVFGENFTARNITFRNSAGPVGQAVAVRIDGDRVMFENCRFLGFQDTLYPHGENSRQYYKNCYIEGTTDFIFGWSTAVFEGCEIYSKKGGKYITAASTGEGSPYGFVFIDCKFTADKGVGNIYLGRPWRPHAKTVLINCELGDHIIPEGWHNWNKPEAEKRTFYAEYNSKGPGANNKRVKWSHRLSEKEVEQYTLDKIFKNWNPLAEKQNSPSK